MAAAAYNLPKHNTGRQTELAVVPVFAAGPDSVTDTHPLPPPAHILDVRLPWGLSSWLSCHHQAVLLLLSFPLPGTAAQGPAQHIPPCPRVSPCRRGVTQPRLPVVVRASYFHLDSDSFLCLLTSWQEEPKVITWLSSLQFSALGECILALGIGQSPRLWRTGSKQRGPLRLIARGAPFINHRSSLYLRG